MSKKHAAFLFALFSLVTAGFAQTADWKPVQQLAPQTFVSVVASVGRRTPRRMCIVQHVTADALTCGLRRQQHEWLQDLPVDTIREVRLEYREGNHILRDAVIGGATGEGLALALAAKDVGVRGGLILGLATAYAGARIGAMAGADSPRIRHGAVVYRKPAPASP